MANWWDTTFGAHQQQVELSELASRLLRISTRFEPTTSAAAARVLRYLMEVPRPSSPPYFIGRNQFDAFVSRFGPVELAFGKAAASFCPHGKLAPWFHGTISRVEAERLVAGRSAGAFLFRYSQTEPDKLSLTYSAAGAQSSATGSLRPKHCLVYNLGTAGFGLSANSAASPSTETDKGGSSSGNGAFENIAAFVAAHSGSRLSAAVASELSLQFQAEIQQEAKALKDEATAAALATGTTRSEDGKPIEVGSAETWSLYGSADLLMGRSSSESPQQQIRKHNTEPSSLTDSASSSSLLSTSWSSPVSATSATESMLAAKPGLLSSGEGADSTLRPLPLLLPPLEPLGDDLSKPHALDTKNRQVSAATANEIMVAELAYDERVIAVQQAAALAESRGHDRARLLVQTEQRLSTALKACRVMTSKARHELALSSDAAVDIGTMALGTGANSSLVESTLTALDTLLEDLNETCAALDRQANIAAAARTDPNSSAAESCALNSVEREDLLSTSSVRCEHGCALALLRLQALAERASFLADVSHSSACTALCISRNVLSDLVPIDSGSIVVAIEAASIAVLEAQSTFLASLPVGSLEDNDQVLLGPQAHKASVKEDNEQQPCAALRSSLLPAARPYWNMGVHLGATAHRNLAQLAFARLNPMAADAASSTSGNCDNEAEGAASIDTAAVGSKSSNTSSWNAAALAAAHHWSKMMGDLPTSADRFAAAVEYHETMARASSSLVQRQNTTTSSPSSTGPLLPLGAAAARALLTVDIPGALKDNRPLDALKLCDQCLVATRLSLGAKPRDLSHDGQQPHQVNDQAGEFESDQVLAILEARALANAAQAHAKQAQYSDALVLQRRCLDHLRAQMEVNAEAGFAHGRNNSDLRPEDLYPKVLNAAAQCAAKGERLRDALHLYELLKATQCYADPQSSAVLEEHVRELRLKLDGTP